MASNEQTYITRILLNSEQAKKEIDGLKAKVEELRKKRDEAWKAGNVDSWKKLGKEIDKNESKIRQLEGSLKSIDHTLGNMSMAGPKQLKDTIKAINKLLNDGSVERGSSQWKALTAALQEANTELKKIKQETAAQESVWSRIAGFFNRNWGLFTQLIGTITGLTMTVRKVVKDFAAMEEAMADTRKYTGLTDQSVRELNEDLKKMDTRTSREELNELAGVAGRLGKTSKKDILDFVEAGNMIKVALGDDLGEGAIDKVGKLAMAFGEDERMGLRGAMLATGSAVNELAQNSSAQAGYLVDFTARVAGFGKQLGLTQAQIMGFGAVMDENLLRDEMAATAFGNMLTKMQTDTAKFAKIAGMDVKKFTDLLNKDANAAILALADNLRKADPQNMMKMLDDMGLDGSRAVGVLSTLADKIDDVRARQQLATKAYQEATSVEKEYAVMNNTVEAEIEKCKKRFQEISVEMGEKLLPVVKHTITGTSMFIRLLGTLISIVSEYKGTIILLTATIGGLVLKKQADVLITKAEVFWNEKLIVTCKRLWAALLHNPMAIVAASMAVVLGLLVDLTSKSRKLAESEDNLDKIRTRAKKSMVEEEMKIKDLIKASKDEKLSKDERMVAINKLKEIIPGYITQLDEETGKYKENKKALDEYLKSLTKKYEIEGAKEMLADLGKEIADLTVKTQKAEEVAKDAKKQTESYQKNQRSTGVYNPQETNFVVANEQRAVNELGEINKQLSKKKEERDRILQAYGTGIYDSETTVSGGKSDTTSNTYKSDAELKKEEAERKKREAEEKRRLKEAEDAAKAESDARIAALTHEYAMGRIAYRLYIQDLADLQREGLEKRRDVYQKGSAEYEKLNRQVEQLTFKGDQQVNRMKLEDLQRCMLRQQAEIEAQAAREEITEEEKQERLRMLEESFLADKVELYREGSKERIDAEWELEQAEQRNKLERERQYLQQVQQVREQYLGMSNDRLMQIALGGLNTLHSRGLISEREYQEALLAIKAQYADYQTQDERDRQAGANALKVARNNARQQLDSSGSSSANLPIVGDIMLYQSTMDQLRQMYQNDEMTHAQYLAAKHQATAQFCESLASQMQAAYNTVNQVMSAASSYFSAQQEYETAMVQKKYEKQIAAAGNNQKKVKKLQEKQQKEEAAIKTKYARRAATIQMAQAVASTAISAINAYSSAAQVPYIGYILAPIAAAAALAAGALQIATIKKQQQAQEAGYYEGGFTGGKRYRKEAGVVHEGEFVANHQAVQNPAVLPFLNFLDQAQRNNTVGSLTAQDVSRSIGAVSGASPSGGLPPIINVQNDNAELRETLEQVRDTQDRLATQLEMGIGVDIPIDGENGVYRRLKRYENLLKNK